MKIEPSVGVSRDIPVSAPTRSPTRSADRDLNRALSLEDDPSGRESSVTTEQCLEFLTLDRRRSYKCGQKLAARRLATSEVDKLAE